VCDGPQGRPRRGRHEPDNRSRGRRPSCSCGLPSERTCPARCPVAWARPYRAGVANAEPGTGAAVRRSGAALITYGVIRQRPALDTGAGYRTGLATGSASTVLRTGIRHYRHRLGFRHGLRGVEARLPFGMLAVLRCPRSSATPGAQANRPDAPPAVRAGHPHCRTQAELGSVPASGNTQGAGWQCWLGPDHTRCSVHLPPAVGDFRRFSRERG